MSLNNCRGGQPNSQMLLRPWKRKRGQILLMVLLVFMLMMALVAGIASTSFLFQRSVDSYTRDRLAENLGDSVIATAAASLKKSSDFSSRIDLKDDAVDARSRAWITFEASDPDHSTNNIVGDGAKQGFKGSVVPAGVAELVAVVEVRGRIYHLVYTIGKSPFPYVVASSGDFRSNGPLLLGALKSLDDLKDGLDPSDLVKGALLSNQALSINGPADVIGDLKTHTRATLVGVNRNGKLEEDAEQEEIPKIKLSDYDPAGKPEIIEFTAARPASSAVKLELSGLARSSVSVTLNKGLVLNGGVLYVDGDLTIREGVTGYGAVFCTGNMSVSGGSDLGSDSLCALVAGKDLTLKGTGAEKTQFRGLVYSDGALTVSDVTVVGALVGNSPSGAPMTVDRANLVYDPEGVSLGFDFQLSGLPISDGIVRDGVKLAPGSHLTPEFLYSNGNFREPTRTELQTGLLFILVPNPPRAWDDLSPEEQQSKGDQLVTIAARVTQGQINDWNSLDLDPQSLNNSYRLDLNRFVKVHNSMKILTHQISRN